AEGTWNRLRVRVEAGKLIAWVNEAKVLEIEDDVLRGGAVGLCKFRERGAAFRGFRVGIDLSEKELPQEEKEAIRALLDRFAAEGGGGEILAELGRDSPGSRQVIRDRVTELEERVANLKELEA